MRRIALSAAAAHEYRTRHGGTPLMVADNPAMPLTAVVDLVEGILVAGGAVK